MTLAQKRCMPCEGYVSALSRDKAQQLLEELSGGWILSEDNLSISKEFKFSGFEEARQFVNRVADIAQTEDHHPNISWRFNKVKLTHTTHVLHGLSENDFILAAKAETVYV